MDFKRTPIFPIQYSTWRLCWKWR